MDHTPITWITGGSQGIGFACAGSLAAKGYRIAISARDQGKLDRAEQKLSAITNAIAITCDVRLEADIQAAYRAILDRFGAAPDVLINCAGMGAWTTFSETSTEQFDAVLETNTRGMFLASREVLPAMYERNSGAIVQLISIAGMKAFKNGAAYVASKFAALGLTNAIREEARKHGVRVIAVFPGATETEMWHENERRQYHERMMQPEDIAQAIVHALEQPARTLIEEIVLRPIQGDI